jgi:hypothetical protein
MRAWVVVLACGCSRSPCPVASPAPAPPTAEPRNEIRRGTPIVVDGRAGDGEWADAGTLALAVAPAWTVTARYKHDGEALLFAFANLGSPQRDAFRYPELLVDARRDGGIALGEDDFWFHASFRDCWSRGGVNDYKSCTPEAPDWTANNYVAQDAAPEVVELRIPFAMVGVQAGGEIGLALNVTDTQRAYHFWPSGGQLAVPSTWGAAKLAP